jgi:ankyrin repeat protein
VLRSRNLADLRESLSHDSALAHFRCRDGQTLLHVAAHSGDVEEAQRLLDIGADINARGNDNNTALHFAIDLRHVKFALFLIDNDADITALNNSGESPLHRAAFTGQPGIIATLLAKPSAKVHIKGVPYIELTDKDKGTALANVFRGDNVEAVEVLLHAGAKPTSLGLKGFSKVFLPRAILPEMDANEVHGMPMLRLLTQNGLRWDAVDSDSDNLLAAACKIKALGYCQLILNGLSTHGKLAEALAHNAIYGRTALHMSARGCPKICRLLLQYGADAQMPGGLDKQTPLEAACASGSEENVQAMLEFTERLGDISEALYLAASGAHLEVCRLLLCQEFDVEYRSKDVTILLAAVRTRNADVVELLLQHGVRAWPEEMTRSETFRWRRGTEEEKRVEGLLDSHGVFQASSQ